MKMKERSNWTNKNISYLKNVNIVEYDLASGGLSIIKEYKLLKKDLIDQLDKLEKKEKNIKIGKLQARNPELSKGMVEGFGSARDLFVKTNNIPEENILSIKKDALFLVNCVGIKQKITTNLIFRKKNSYSSYIRLNDKEFYFSPITNELDIKGLGEQNEEYQKNFLLKDIYRFLKQSEKINKKDLYQNLKEYRSKYLNRKLPIETYRNLDTGIFIVNNFEIETIDETFINDIDISYNYIHYILPLIKELLK